MAQPNPKLRRVLTTPLVTLYGLGVTVGAGIYVLVGTTAAEAGANAPIAFLVAALVVAFTAFSYAELSTRYPVSAGEAAYVDAGFRRGWLTTGVGLAVALSGMVSAAAVSIGAASYLGQFIAVAEPLLVMLIVASMGVIAFWGISQSVTVAAVITVLEILGLVFVAGWGFFVSDKLGVEAIEIISPVSRAQWIGIGSASLLAFFAFVGFEDMANVAEEVKVPKRTMPRAIILTLIVATALYLATTTAVLLVVPLDQLSASTAPLLLVFEGADETVQFGFGVLAIVATVNGVLIQTIMASRVIFGLADRNHLPAVFAKVSQTTRTPSVATLSVVLVILILGQALPIEALAERTSQIVLMIFIVVNLSLVRLKRQTKPPADCFNVPLAVPILGILTSLGLLVMSVF